MELQHTFTVPAPIEQAWSTLLDVEGIAPCFPGATLTGVDGDAFSGTVKVKLGPVSLQYAGKGRFVERDEAARRVLLEANGSDRRGNGTAGATVRARLEPDGENATKVVVDTDLKVTGRPAQFGRGVLQDVGGRIIDQFATCLASRMSAETAEPAAAAAATSGRDSLAAAASSEAAASNGQTAEPGRSRSEDLGVADQRAAAPVEPAAPRPPAPPQPAPEQQEVAELDLGAVVLPTLARRYGPPVLAGLLAVLVVWLVRRRSR